MTDIPGKEHAAKAVGKVKKLPPWALVAIGIGGLAFAYMIYKARNANNAATNTQATDPNLDYSTVAPDYASAGSVPIAGASMGGGGGYGGGYGFTDPGAGTVPTGAGTGASTDMTTSNTTDNAVTGENVGSVLDAAGSLVGAGFAMGKQVPATGGGAPDRPHPAGVHAPPTKKDKQGHTAAQRAQIRHSSPAKRAAYEKRLRKRG